MKNRWAILAVLFLVRTTFAIQFQAVAALSPVMMGAFGIGLAEIGVLIGLYLAPGIVVAYPGGAIGRRFGDTRAVAGGMVLMIAGGLLMALGESWEAQVAGRLVAGTGGIVLNVLMSKMVQDWFAGREIATAMGIFVNSWPIGIAAALVVLPVIAGAGGYALASFAVTGLVAAGLALLLLAYRPAAAAAARGAPRVPVAGAALSAIVLAGLIWGLYNAALQMVFGFGPAMLVARGWALTDASWATSLVLWLFAVSVPLGGFIADRTGRRDAVLVVGVLCFALAMVWATWTGAVLIAFTLLGLFGGIAVGPIMSLPAEVLAPASRAQGMGIFFTLHYACVFVAPSAAGLVAEWTGTAAATFVLGAAMLVACPALLVAFRRTWRPPASGPG